MRSFNVLFYLEQNFTNLYTFFSAILNQAGKGSTYAALDSKLLNSSYTLKVSSAHYKSLLNVFIIFRDYSEFSQNVPYAIHFELLKRSFES